jgi:hypothetical protein
MRKIALKRLTKSDLTFFRWHFDNNNAGNQKAINLNADVFVQILFPGLPAEATVQPRGRFKIDLSVYGPGQAPELNLQRKIIKTSSYKNWRLNGEFIDNPSEEPARFNTLQEGDFALFEFGGTSYPESTKLCLIDQTESGRLHSACGTFLGARRMAALQEADLDRLLRAAGVEDVFPISGSTLEGALEDAALGGLEGLQRLARRSAARPLTKDELRLARERAEQTGEAGEQFINDYFAAQLTAATIEQFKWVSESSATAPYDFELTKSGTTSVLDVKATNGPFENRIHVSIGELLHMSACDGEYRIYRVYGIAGNQASLRISESMRAFAERVLPLLDSLPDGVTVDGLSINPNSLLFGPELRLRLLEEQD